MSIFHRHKHIWTVKEKHIVDAPYKDLISTGFKASGYYDISMLFKSTVVVYYKCYDCPAEKVEKL